MATSCPGRFFDNLPLDILWNIQESSSLSDSAKRDRFFALIDRIGLQGTLFETWVADSLVILLGPAAINDHPILKKVCPLSRPSAIPLGRSISLRDYAGEPPLRDQYPIQTWPYEPCIGLEEWRQWIDRLSESCSGPLTINLYDLSVLFGLLPHGHDFGTVSSEDSIFSDEFISSWFGKSYIAVMRQPALRNPKEDHFKFLVVFFTKYLFCSRGKECTLHFVPLVRHLLESDNPVALGPLVLASIYRGLCQFTTETPSELLPLANGPLWLVQIWLMASLRELTQIWPQNFQPDGPTSYGYQFVLPLPPQGVRASPGALFHLTNRNPANIAYVRLLPNGPAYLRDESADHPNFAAAWKSILPPWDLMTDLTVIKNEPRKSVEVYDPHYCAA
ncbi:hypothetical protein Tsubulata_014778 [Turnera subulata]|uniref:Aminotransferase-like plant mobile domain-containing protein n=1 Tax=Turnera subulata TaxID=218843 RepID=A0A9Q0FAG0_9ROSI|nr:hypothetical protein Tsubulata_014778 [Turnera subulata]